MPIRGLDSLLEASGEDRRLVLGLSVVSNSSSTEKSRGGMGGGRVAPSVSSNSTIPGRDGRLGDLESVVS